MEEPEALKLKEKVGLSDEEVMQILRCGRGQGLLCAGKNRIAVEIRSSQTLYDLITTNRADLESNRQISRYINTHEIMKVAEHNGRFCNIPKHGRK